MEPRGKGHRERPTVILGVLERHRLPAREVAGQLHMTGRRRAYLNGCAAVVQTDATRCRPHLGCIYKVGEKVRTRSQPNPKESTGPSAPRSWFRRLKYDAARHGHAG